MYRFLSLQDECIVKSLCVCLRVRLSNPDTDVNPYNTQNVVETLNILFYDLTIFGTNIYSVDDFLTKQKICPHSALGRC